MSCLTQICLHLRRIMRLHTQAVRAPRTQSEDNLLKSHRTQRSQSFARPTTTVMPVRPAYLSPPAPARHLPYRISRGTSAWRSIAFRPRMHHSILARSVRDLLLPNEFARLKLRTPDVEYGTGFPLEKSISEYDMNASFGMGLMHSDIALYNSQSTYDTDGFDALAYSNMLYQNSMSCTAPVTNGYRLKRMPLGLAEPYALSEMSTYDAFSQTPYVDACYTEFFSTPENVEKEYFPQYSAWDFPVPEQTFVGQTSTIIPPSLPQFTSSYGVYAS
ncbi:hypothetical protein C8Q78DRAFT_84521 [Trametes maxima]|nr:hypothetical protein C8Q78DRAFT_84521 [Trametes maxima]